MEPLGEPGITAYRTLLEEAWEALPEEADPAQLRAMREQLAKSSGDVDAMVEVLADGLPTPKAYRDIVTLLRQAGRLDEAIQWAERGVTATRDVGLTDLLIQSYIEAQRADDAVELRKSELREAPTRLCYARLKATAVEAKVWSGLRSWALAVLAAEPTELVGALLDDGEVAEAWQAAKKHDCVGIEIARRWAETNPTEALPAYRSMIEACLSRNGRDAYREGGILLQEYAKLATRCGEQITDYVTSLKTRHARRPALLDELRRAGF
jgi:tetratricopeptide (TPR) repeat protein